MTQKPYIENTYRKFSAALPNYEPFLFRTVGYAEKVTAVETDEHLRLPPDEDRMNVIGDGTPWGREYGNMWLRTGFTVPECAEGKILCAIPDTGAAEILCYKNGKPAGIMNTKNNFLGGLHGAFFVTPCAKAGERFELAFECYAGHTDLGTSFYDNYYVDEEHPGNEGRFRHVYRGIRFVVMDTLIRDFIFDFSTVLQLARLPDNNFIAKRAYSALMDAFPYFIFDVRGADEDEIHESCAKIRDIIAPALEKHSDNDGTRGSVGVIGHSHMDTAWLWPVSETIRKCARTYSEVLTLMEMYPEYTFIQSSALHLDWMKQYYPDIFEGIKQRVAEGRYEPNGGVWVECDCNVTGGEAMVRQFLYGQRYTQKELGYRSDAFWLPDTFGYNGAIPQIMKGAGVKYFYTTKMSWADLNQFPADTFIWRGIDGTEVLTHLNRMHLIPDVPTINEAVNGIRDKLSEDKRLAAYGYGDGGGGPTYGQLEYLSRVKDLPGMPEVHPVTASSFMKELEADIDRLPLFDGELYLEFHRGTLTTMHEVKRNNRKTELAFYNMELFNVLSGKPKDARHDELYKILLKNQFHDILPGTCIPKVYEIAIPEMYGVQADAKEVTDGFINGMTQKDDGTLSFYNPLSFDRDDVITADGAFALENTKTQTYTDADGNEKTAVALNIPAMESVTAKKTAMSDKASAFSFDGCTLETPIYSVKFDESGYISSLIDKRVCGGRQVCRAGAAPLGTLWFGEDASSSYDNWEVESDIFRKLNPITELCSKECVSDGAVEYRIRNVYKVGKKSAAYVDVVFYAENPRIDFEMKLDWHERHHLLKAGFDVNIRSAFFKNEIQFGHVDRPTTRNTSLEAAKFEVCNHKWSDISETRYGVAILNDCKYGISCEESDMRLTLQRGGCRPDFKSDFGVHYMTYSLLPHVGGFNADSVVKPAYMLNIPAVCREGMFSAPKLFGISAPGIICEAVKPAEDIENAYVLRLYECERSDANCEITFSDAKSVTLCNLLEEPVEILDVTDGKADLHFHAFEIKSLLVERK